MLKWFNSRNTCKLSLPRSTKVSVSIHPSVYASTVLLLDLDRFFSVSYSYIQSVRLLGWGFSPSQCRYLHTEQTQTQSKRTQTSKSRVGFELTIPALKWEKKVRALDGAATVIGNKGLYLAQIVVMVPSSVTLWTDVLFCSHLIHFVVHHSHSSTWKTIKWSRCLYGCVIKWSSFFHGRTVVLYVRIKKLY
jgi:hypothetical protein